MKRLVLATALAVVFASPALAGHCPKDVKRIDAALAKKSTLTAEQIDKVKALRDKGMRLHGAGRHGDSLGALHEAMRMLGVSH